MYLLVGRAVGNKNWCNGRVNNNLYAEKGTPILVFPNFLIVIVTVIFIDLFCCFFFLWIYCVEEIRVNISWICSCEQPEAAGKQHVIANNLQRGILWFMVEVYLLHWAVMANHCINTHWNVVAAWEVRILAWGVRLKGWEMLFWCYLISVSLDLHCKHLGLEPSLYSVFRECFTCSAWPQSQLLVYNKEQSCICEMMINSTV